MNNLTALQLTVALIASLAIGFLTCYTILYEDMKDKYNELKEQMEQERQLPLENTTFKHYHDYHNVA